MATARCKDWFVGLPGDIIFTAGEGVIRLTQRVPGEAPTKAGHVAGLVGPQTVLEARLTVQTKSIRRFKAETPTFWVYRRQALTPDQRDNLADALHEFSGRLYGGPKLLLHLGDWALAWARYGLTLGAWKGEAYAFRRLLCLDAFPICSWVYARAYEKVLGYQFGVPAAEANPDQMLDWVESHPEEWELIYVQGVEG